MSDVTPNFKPDPIDCPCGCGAVGQPKKNGHPKTCLHSKCARCRNKNSRVKGRRKQAAATTALGVPRSALSPGHEEFLGGTVRLEVKAGAQVSPILTRYLAMEAQSEAARPFGDTRPFVGVAMPEGVKWGLVMVRTDRLEETVAALAEQFGITS